MAFGATGMLLKRAYAHLTQGMRPHSKLRNLRDLNLYLQIASKNDMGTSIVKKSSAFIQGDLIDDPQSIQDGMISALHLQFGRPSCSQLNQVFDPHFYEICRADAIKGLRDKCDMCNSLKKIPN